MWVDGRNKLCGRRIKEHERTEIRQKTNKRGRTRVEGQGEGRRVSLLGRWWGVFSFVLVQ